MSNQLNDNLPAHPLFEAIMKITRRCPKCNRLIVYARKGAKVRAIRENSCCRSCVHTTGRKTQKIHLKRPKFGSPEYKIAMSNSLKHRWKHPTKKLLNRFTPRVCHKISKGVKRLWNRPSYKNKIIAAIKGKLICALCGKSCCRLLCCHCSHKLRSSLKRQDFSLFPKMTYIPDEVAFTYVEPTQKQSTGTSTF